MQRQRYIFINYDRANIQNNFYFCFLKYSQYEKKNPCDDYAYWSCYVEQLHRPRT